MFNEKDCIDSLQKAKEILGESPSESQYSQLGLSPTSSTIKRKLGGWNKAKEKANLETVSACHHRPVPVETNTLGYEEVRCNDGGGSDRITIHRLLAVAEYGIQSVKNMDVHHKNEIRWDNRPSNIELMTRSEHATHHLS